MGVRTLDFLDGFESSTQPSVVGAASVVLDYHTVTAGEITAKQLTIASTPSVVTNVMVDIVGGPTQKYATDYTVSGAILDWNGLGLEAIIEAGDIMRIFEVS